MAKCLVALALGASIVLGTAVAAPAKQLNVTEKIEIHAPLAKVWETVKDFDSLNKWHPAFAKDEIVKGKNNQPGAVRALTIKDGPTFTEELLGFDEAKHSYKYRIIESPLPLSDYSSTLSLAAGKDGTT